MLILFKYNWRFQNIMLIFYNTQYWKFSEYPNYNILKYKWCVLNIEINYFTYHPFYNKHMYLNYIKLILSYFQIFFINSIIILKSRKLNNFQIIYYFCAKIPNFFLNNHMVSFKYCTLINISIKYGWVPAVNDLINSYSIEVILMK